MNVPTLVVQGENDPFGTPPEGPDRTVTRIPGTHSFKSDASVAAAVSEWLAHVGLGVAGPAGEFAARAERPA